MRTYTAEQRQVCENAIMALRFVELYPADVAAFAEAVEIVVFAREREPVNKAAELEMVQIIAEQFERADRANAEEDAIELADNVRSWLPLLVNPA